MLDLSHIPSQQQQNYTFYATGNWQAWNKPRNAKFIEIFCLGGGGGGSHPTNQSTAGSGGAGGSSAGIVRGIIPAFLLPDTLYILVGKGGAGGTVSNTTGGSGAISYIGLQPSTSEQTLICKSSTTAGQTTTAPTISVISLSSKSSFLTANTIHYKSNIFLIFWILINLIDNFFNKMVCDIVPEEYLSFVVFMISQLLF